MRRGLGAVNRLLLGLIGLILLAAALAGAVISSGLVSRRIVPVSLPSGSVPAADQPVVPRAWWDWIATQPGTWTLSAAGVLVGLLGLWWLIVQVPRPRPNKPFRWRDDSGAGLSSCAPAAIADVVADQIESIPGVQKASVSIYGAASDPILEADVTVEERADVTAIQQQITNQVCSDVATTIGGTVHSASLRFDVSRGSREVRSIELAS